MKAVKSLWSKLMLTAAATLLMTMFFGLTACAAVGDIKNLRQTEDSSKYVTVAWDGLLNQPYYEYSISEDGKTWTTPKPSPSSAWNNFTSNTEQMISGLSEGKTYYVKIKSFTDGATSTVRTYDGRESAVLKIKTSPARVEGLKESKATDTSLTLQWNKAAGADYYEVYSYTLNADYSANLKYVGKTTGTSYTASKLKADNRYSYAVLPIADTGTYEAVGSYTDKYMGFQTLPGKVTGLDSDQFSTTYNKKSKYGTLRVTWDQKQTADGFQVQFFEYKNLKKVKKTININKGYQGYAEWTKALKNKIYAVKVRPYATINNKKLYSGWTSYRYIPYQPDVSSLKVTGGKLKVSWKKVTGATSYDIYVSTSNKSNAKYTRVAKNISAKKTSATVSKYKGKKFNSKKKYYTYVVANFKKGGKTYKSDFSWYYYNY